MTQTVRCPQCGKAMRLPEQAAGKRVRCPHDGCHRVFLVGTSPANAADPARADDAEDTDTTRTSAVTAVASRATVCPACQAPLLPGAIACMDCGFLLRAGGAGEEGPPNLCPNPACGVANAPRDRLCRRCGSPLPTPPGTLLHGRYRVERQLAVGGFGAVYLAADTKAGDLPVAVKDMICADPGEFDIRLNFFRREAEILRSLEALPIVPRVYDFIEQGQAAHLVMEYIRGRNLLQIMEAGGGQPFPLDRVVDWGRSICEVLAHLHGRTPPLIHRDLKPDNIMLAEGGDRIKLIDFGTARDVGRTRRSRLATKTRVFTEGYAPPEQVVGKPEPRSDLFALAGTLFHLATGRMPEGAATARELETQLADPAGPLPAEHRWFFDLIRINLAEDVAGRYFSAREFQADLERRQVTREVACARCGATNAAREPYCVRCAEPLTDPAPPCSHCGKQSRMGSRWCIHCGHRLR